MKNLKDHTAAIRQAKRALDKLEQFTLTELPDEVEPEELLQMMLDLHSVKRQIADIYTELEAQVADSVGYMDKPMQIADASIEIKSGSPRKTWSHDKLKDMVSTRVVDLSVNMDTGATTRSPKEMIEAALDCAGISYWKVGMLRELGLEADDFSVVQDPKKNIVIRREK